MQRVCAALFFVACMLVVASAAGADENISGSFALRMGETEFPIYPRGDGNLQHWQFDQGLRLSSKKTDLVLRSRLIGGTIMDNPDQFAFDFEVRHSLRDVFVMFFHDDAYALNRAPVLDPTARIPNASMNSWQIGVGYGNRDSSIQFRHTFAGVTPLYYTYHTGPYVRYAVHGERLYRIPNAIEWKTEVSLAIGEHLEIGHGMVTSRFLMPLTPRVRVGAEYIGRFNFGVPKTLGGHTALPDRHGVFGVLDISFGK